MVKQFQDSEQYIIDESQELNLGANPLIQKFFRAFPALTHKNYQLYFLGQSVSLTGTWIQLVAQGWLVFQITHSAFWVGSVAALSNIPTLLFGLVAGVVVDRYPRKKIIFIAESFSLLCAFVLGMLTILDIVQLWHICLIMFLMGISAAFDMPARQTFAIDMVGKENLSSAIALNAGLFNAARVVGPGIAGMLIAFMGVGGAFLANAFSYLAVLIALYFIKVSIQLPKTYPRPIDAIKQGIRYSFTHPAIKILLVFSSISSIFSWSYVALMPVIAQRIFHLDASGLGYLYSAAGIGAVLGTVIVSAYSHRINPMTFILGGNFLFAIAIILFTLTDYLYLAYVFLFFAGLGLITQFATTNSTIQQVTEDSIRGRVMSIYTLMFVGLIPVGSFQAGIIADMYSSKIAIQLGAVVVSIAGIYLYTIREKISKVYYGHVKSS